MSEVSPAEGEADESNGGSGGIRTLGQCLKRALLYQLSYQPTLELSDWTA